MRVRVEVPAMMLDALEIDQQPKNFFADPHISRPPDFQSKNLSKIFQLIREYIWYVKLFLTLLMPNKELEVFWMSVLDSGKPYLIWVFIGSQIIAMIWNVVFANKSRKLGWIWMKLGRWR